MSKYSALVASIAANPELHQVDRAAKMEATMDVMCKNLERHHRIKSDSALPFDEQKARGYGTGRKTGD